MRDLVRLMVWMVSDLFRSRTALEAEIRTFAAADKRSAANRSQETNLQRHRPLDFCLPLSASPWRSRCAGDCQTGDRGQMASRWLPFILAMEIESAGRQANRS